jgi:hypothetical protein
LLIDPKSQFLTEMGTLMLIENYPVNQIIRTKLLIKDFAFGIKRPATTEIIWLLLNGFPVL